MFLVVRYHIPFMIYANRHLPQFLQVTDIDDLLKRSIHEGWWKKKWFGLIVDENGLVKKDGEYGRRKDRIQRRLCSGYEQFFI